jgi:predicted transcriptional regulator YdeE
MIAKNFCLLLTLLSGGMSMHPKIVNIKEFAVVGIRVRTNNAREMTQNGLIPGQWQKFMQGNLLAKIPDRFDSHIFVLYTNYASDRNGDYDYIIGARVNPNAKVPDGMVMKKVPTGKYAVFASEKGPIANVTVGVWKQIWAIEDAKSGEHRAYKTDYEVHDERAVDPQNSQIDVYVGIK